jgi:hypothetical protein
LLALGACKKTERRVDRQPPQPLAAETARPVADASVADASVADGGDAGPAKF